MRCAATSCAWRSAPRTTSRRRTSVPSPTTSSSPSLTREVKTRRESVDAYTKAGRQDLADKEQSEIDILGEYLPAAMSEDEIRALVAQGIAETGATSARDLGKVMGWLSPRTRGRADGKVVSGLVAQALAERRPRRARRRDALTARRC